MLTDTDLDIERGDTRLLVFTLALPANRRPMRMTGTVMMFLARGRGVTILRTSEPTGGLKVDEAAMTASLLLSSGDTAALPRGRLTRYSLKWYLRHADTYGNDAIETYARGYLIGRGGYLPHVL